MGATSRRTLPDTEKDCERLWSVIGTVERNRLFIEAGGMVARNFIMVSAALTAAAGLGWWVSQMGLK